MASRPNSRPGAASDGRLHAPPNGVTVRMYRTGLGDCFLLALPRAKADADGRADFYILIDCGVYYRTPEVVDPDTNQKIRQEDWIRKIARHIKDATGGRIDVVAITHEHWDHVSGFHQSQARDDFAAIVMGDLWLAWTEDMSIELARKLKEEGGADHDTLARAVAEMEKRRGMSDSGTYQMSDKVLGFFGAKDGSRKRYSKETAGAMEWIRSTWAAANKIRPKFLHPGQLTHLAGVSPDLARVYILGPPENEKILKVTDRKGAAYRMGIGWPSAASCFAAFGVLPSVDADARRAREMNIPFDRRYRRTEAEYERVHPRLFSSYRSARIRLLPGLKDAGEIPTRGRNLIVVATVDDVIHLRVFHDGKVVVDKNEKELKKKSPKIADLREQLAAIGSKAPSPTDEDALMDALASIIELPADNRWRTIDFDWAEPAAAFALQLDNKTNNTSLAFALEIGTPGEGKVLLFPGDAQVGNWLSWFGPVKVQGEKKPVGAALAWDVAGKTVTAEDLMRRTVLYKVGHHGSHNATLRARGEQPSGVKLMTSEDLVALIPVDEYVAHAKAHYGDMPQPDIVADLLEMTRGRVARNDEGAAYSPEDAPVLNGVGLHGRKPREKFKGKRVNGLYIEYDVTL